MNIKNMPCVTVEQVLALRSAAMQLQKELDDLKAHNEQLQSLLSVKELCVNKIKADAVREGIGRFGAIDGYNAIDLADHLEGYASQLEQGDTE